MIVYNLVCTNGHEFEGWFRDSAAYDEEARQERLACPSCNSKEVEKAIMAPALATAALKPSLSAGDAREMRQFMTGLRKYVQENADYVGQDFAEEARKIHYGEAPDRHIYGETTPEEAKDLIEEGVDVAPLPPDLDQAN